MLTQDIARICHEANRALQIVQNDPGIPVSPPWDSAPEWMTSSTKAGVVSAFTSHKTPRQLHGEWMEYKLKEGWVYGEVRDSELMVHPCLVPYEELPLSQRIKDNLFLAIVNVFK